MSQMHVLGNMSGDLGTFSSDFSDFRLQNHSVLLNDYVCTSLVETLFGRVPFEQSPLLAGGLPLLPRIIML